MVKTYTALFELDQNGAWIVRVPAIRGCHTYGRTLNQGRRRIREALSLWVDDAEDAVIEEQVRLPATARLALQRAKRARERAEWAQSRAQEETERTARALLDELGIGMRDAGELLGLSHQRVQQLVRD